MAYDEGSAREIESGYLARAKIIKLTRSDFPRASGPALIDTAKHLHRQIPSLEFAIRRRSHHPPLYAPGLMIDYALPSAIGLYYKAWQWNDGSAWKDFDPPTCTSLDDAQTKGTDVSVMISQVPHTANALTKTLLNKVTGQTYKMQSNPPVKIGSSADLTVRERLAGLGINFVDVSVNDPLASEQCVICMGELHEEGEGIY